MNKKLLSILLLVGLFSSCKTTEHQLDELPDTYLSYGSGGGFAGSLDEIFIFENGQVLESKTFVDSTIVHPKVKKSEVKSLIDYVLKENLLTYKMFKPGNLYYFINIKIDGAENRIVWGVERGNTPERIAPLYNKLVALTSQIDTK